MPMMLFRWCIPLTPDSDLKEHKGAFGKMGEHWSNFLHGHLVCPPDAFNRGLYPSSENNHAHVGKGCLVLK